MMAANHGFFFLFFSSRNTYKEKKKKEKKKNNQSHLGDLPPTRVALKKKLGRNNFSVI
jgi:hypothetical protein